MTKIIINKISIQSSNFWRNDPVRIWYPWIPKAIAMQPRRKSLRLFVHKDIHTHIYICIYFCIHVWIRLGSIKIVGFFAFAILQYFLANLFPIFFNNHNYIFVYRFSNNIESKALHKKILNQSTIHVNY